MALTGAAATHLACPCSPVVVDHKQGKRRLTARPNASELALRLGRGIDSEALQRNWRVDTGDAARVHGRVALRRLTTCDVLVGERVATGRPER